MGNQLIIRLQILLLFLLVTCNNIEGKSGDLIKSESPLMDEVVLIVDDILVDCGEEFTIFIRVENFVDISGLQFSLSFDPSVLTFVSWGDEIGQGLMNANTSNAGSGSILVSWGSFSAVTLPDGSAVLSLTFILDGDCSAPTLVEITNSPLIIEISTLDDVLPYILEQGIVGVSTCDVIVDAGPDQILCHPGGQTSLEGSIDGTYIDFEWIPPTGLSDPTSLTPTLTVTGPVDYTLQTRSVSDNLLYNGDFESGNTGFTSEYTYDDLLGLIDPATYAIATSPDQISSIFPQCVDHTSGMGNSMVVHGGTSAQEEVWCQQVSVEPNTDYFLQAWVTTVVPLTIAQLQFSINGNPVGPVQSPSSAFCDWVEISTIWNSGGNSSATFCILDMGTSVLGDIYALDDISLYQICVEEDMVHLEVGPELTSSIDTTICDGEVVRIGTEEFNMTGSYQRVIPSVNGCDSTIDLNLEVIQLNAVIGTPDDINCNEVSVVLDGSLSTQGPNIGYFWETTDGNIVSGQGTDMIVVDQGGTYSLTVSYDDGEIQCQSSVAFMFVAENTMEPAVTIDSVPEFDCAIDAAQIITDPEYPGINPSWSTFDGLILAGAGSFTPLVGGPGTYTLDVVDPLSLCTNQYEILVTGDTTVPIAFIDGDTLLDCGQDTLKLFSIGTTSGPNISLNWFTTDGQIIGISTEDSVVIVGEGSYGLSVINTLGDCADTAYHQISSTDGFTVTIQSQDPNLNCNVTTTVLEANVDQAGLDYQYLWIANPGLILTTNDSNVVEIGDQGIYTIIVSTPDGLCEARDTIIMTADTSKPDVQTSPDLVLDCQTDSLMLVGFPDTSLAISTVRWSTIDGNILGDPNQDTIWIDQTGIYEFSQVNEVNGCSSEASTFITPSIEVPTVEIQSDTVLNCGNNEVNLTSTGSSTGIQFIYNWSTSDGSIMGNLSSLSVTAVEPGTYSLTIIDTTNSCSAQANHVVNSDTLAPSSNAGADSQIDCQNTTVVLDGSLSSSGPEISYSWSTTDGNILTDPNSIQITVNAGGTYILIVQDDHNFCSSIDSVNVTENGLIPTASIRDHDSLNCNNQTIILDGTGSSFGPNFAFQWLSLNGNFVSQTDSVIVEVNEPGIYILEVTDLSNLCVVTDTTAVGLDTAISSFTLSSDGNIDCMNDEVELTASFSGTIFHDSQSWTTTTGNIISDSTASSILIDEGGRYDFRIENFANGCSNSGTIIVNVDISFPIADAGPDEALDCQLGTAMLSGAGSSQGSDFRYLWFTDDGQITSNPTDQDIEVNSGGTYVLIVENLSNGCSSVDTALVSENGLPAVHFRIEDPNCGGRPGKLIIDSLTGGVPPYMLFLNQDLLDLQEPEFEIVPGDYTIEVVDASNCASGDIFSISEGQELELTLNPIYVAQAGDVIVLDAQVNIDIFDLDSIQWTPSENLDCTNCLNPQLTVMSNSFYTLNVTSNLGCTDVATTEIRVEDRTNVYIPNAFSPNGDGVNEVFRLYGPNEFLLIKSFEIYDRWGNRVFHRTNLPLGSTQMEWDGTKNGKKLDPAVFAYFVELQLSDGNTKTLKGSVQLMH